MEVRQSGSTHHKQVINSKTPARRSREGRLSETGWLAGWQTHKGLRHAHTQHTRQLPIPLRDTRQWVVGALTIKHKVHPLKKSFCLDDTVQSEVISTRRAALLFQIFWLHSGTMGVPMVHMLWYTSTKYKYSWDIFRISLILWVFWS